ncbi:50S ribosomal protein L33 [Paenibacillus sp. YN15]|uniref:50S ribosomal protein L33 n=1 Tax=Paenibacillus sp. YN15 TaxID=1742774 RepID=UPI000DCD3560|nr:50S ribosomal protein L33 [Paenibacillus sp. YN15]RAV06553.1 50S ribosomal protein L33 [Paenibacillus sp. YN15]
MARKIRIEDVQKLVGKQVYCLKKDGSVASGKLVRISGGGRLHLLQAKGKARTKAILPLALFDILAIGTSPYAYGGYGYGYPGYGYGGYGGGFGYPGYGFGGGFPFI